MGLSWQQGPIAPGAVGHFLTDQPVPDRLLFAEPARRRMRIRFDNAWIADSEQAILLHGPGHYPVAYLPIEHVEQGVLVPTDRTTTHRDLGATRWFTVAGPGQRAERTAVTSGPDGVLFSRDHLWVRVTDGTARVGLTDFAQQTLGDIVDISRPGANDRVTAGQACDVESTKSVNDLLAPVSGVVMAINADLAERPEGVNTHRYGGGWLIDVRLGPGAGTADLLSAADYAQLIGR